MADTQKKDTASGAEATAEDTYPLDDLIARSSDFLDCPTFVAAGALDGRVRPMTLSDAKDLVEAWLKQPASEEA